MKVIKHFQDTVTNKYYRVGADYKGDRIGELQSKGFLESHQSEILEGSTKEIKKHSKGLSVEQLEELLIEEKENRNRKTVVQHFESLLADE